MTALGKALVFILLVLGVGVAMGSTLVYTLRPPWFDPIPETVDKGHDPRVFKKLQEEITTLTRAATGFSREWGDGARAVEAKEKLRRDRQAALNTRLAIAQQGDRSRQDQAGFFDQLVDPATGLIDIGRSGPVVVGPGNEPLRAADTLLAIFTKDAREVADLYVEIDKLREQQAVLGQQVQATEQQLLKQIDIRENLREELGFLAGFEINWYEQRETVNVRKRQLDAELKRFGK
jgi:DNA repair exonuclease SbcCD ATPase subunit